MIHDTYTMYEMCRDQNKEEYDVREGFIRVDNRTEVYFRYTTTGGLRTEMRSGVNSKFGYTN